jgi:hypothetical protein
MSILLTLPSVGCDGGGAAAVAFETKLSLKNRIQRIATHALTPRKARRVAAMTGTSIGTSPVRRGAGSKSADEIGTRSGLSGSTISMADGAREKSQSKFLKCRLLQI